MNANPLSRLLALVLASSLGSAALAAEPAVPAQPDRPQLEQQLEAARARLDEAAREVSDLSARLGRDIRGRMQQRLGGQAMPRATLGMQVQRTGDGLRVAAVSPGGPAATAGVKEGDVITSVGGTGVAGEGNPAMALLARIRGLTPGLAVKLGVLREGKAQELDITPQAAAAPFAARRGERDARTAPPRRPRQGMPGMAGRQQPASRFGGMELATLSERLGGYFGVKAGVLVVRAGRNEAFKLQDGDVILAIDGRTPESAAHAVRILATYRGGEKLTLRVQRDRRAQNIEVTLPERPAPGRPGQPGRA